MNTAKEITIQIESAICETVFQMTRAEFISEAILKAGNKWAFLDHHNDFENALDWVNIEALNAHNNAMDAFSYVLEQYPHMVKNVPILISTVTPLLKSSKVDYIWERQS